VVKPRYPHVSAFGVIGAIRGLNYANKELIYQQACLEGSLVRMQLLLV